MSKPTLIACLLGALVLVGFGAYLVSSSIRIGGEIAARFERLQVDLEHVTARDEFLRVVKADGMACTLKDGPVTAVQCRWSPEDKLGWLGPPKGIWIDAEFIGDRKSTAYKVERRQ